MLLEKVANSTIRNAASEWTPRLYNTGIYTAEGRPVSGLYLQQCPCPQGQYGTRDHQGCQLQFQDKQDSPRGRKKRDTLNRLMLTRTLVHHSVLSSISVLPQQATGLPKRDAVGHGAGSQPSLRGHVPTTACTNPEKETHVSGQGYFILLKMPTSGFKMTKRKCPSTKG